MSVNKDYYEGAVGIVHFSDESISDPNCLCFATKDETIKDDTWANLEYGNIFNYKSRIIQLDKDLSKLKKIHFCFASCYSLQKLFIHGKTRDNDGNEVDIEKPEDWEKQIFASFVGSFDEAVHSNYGFRNISNVKTIELKFPKLVRCVGDFCNCKSLETLDTNFSSCLIAEREFDNCPKLATITFHEWLINDGLDKDGGLNKLMFAPGMFANCTSLKKFNYGLPVLLSGKRMFYKCNLNTASATKILGSLPEIKLCRSTNNTVGTEALLNIIKSKGWTQDENGIWGKKNENGIWDGLLKDIKRDKSTNYDRMLIYYKYHRHDYTTKKNEDDPVTVPYNSRAISYDDFGVLDLGVGDEDSVKKSSQLKEAIAKGWKIYINNNTKMQDAFYYEKEGTITIKEETSSVLGSSSYKTIFTGTYYAYGARQKGKDGKLKIKILKTSGTEAITLTTDETIIYPKSTTNDDGLFVDENENVNEEDKNITLQINKGVDRKIKVSSIKTSSNEITLSFK